jgi:hypothetical protein
VRNIKVILKETSQRKIDVEVEKRGETESNIIQNHGHCEKDRRAEIAETIFTAGSTIITAEEVKRRLLKVHLFFSSFHYRYT